MGRTRACDQVPANTRPLSTANLDNLYQASQECRRNINWKDSVLGFQANLGFNLIQLRNELLNGTYKLRPYKRFVIYEPKKRDIEATCHRDRIVTRISVQHVSLRGVDKALCL
jgi:retron-type reverse transcriptase